MSKSSHNALSFGSSKGCCQGKSLKNNVRFPFATVQQLEQLQQQTSYSEGISVSNGMTINNTLTVGNVFSVSQTGDKSVVINGDLEVSGIIDPTGLILDGQTGTFGSDTSIQPQAGMIWVKNDEPSNLIYTDSQGNDFNMSRNILRCMTIDDVNSPYTIMPNEPYEFYYYTGTSDNDIILPVPIDGLKILIVNNSANILTAKDHTASIIDSIPSTKSMNVIAKDNMWIKLSFI